MRSILKKLPKYCQDLATKVEAETDYPVRVTGDVPLGCDTKVTRARPKHPFHTIALDAKFSYVDHAFILASYSLLRYWALPPEQRCEPATTHHELILQPLPLPPTTLVSDVILSFLIQDMFTLSDNILIEHDIAATLPEHSQRQRKYLREQIQVLLKELPDMAEAFIKSTYRRLSAINIAYAREAAAITNEKLDAAFRLHPHRGLADILLSYVPEARARGPHGHRFLSDAWAQALKLRHLYTWVRSDELD
jgi:hypothetical protein